MSLDRRALLGGAVIGAGTILVFGTGLKGGVSPTSGGTYEVNLTPAEWRRKLTRQQYDILREAQTEYPHTSPLNTEKRRGIFSCAGCDLPLFSSKTKFDSGTGWPSFWAPLPNAVATRNDGSLGIKRIEVHCRRCGGHQGHVFDDGPPPTGKRYCINGLALKFTPGRA